MSSMPRASRVSTIDPLGDMLRRARHLHTPPLTQEDVADSLGFVQSTVSAWESGKARPSTEVLPTLARTLGIKLADLKAAVAASG